jgi:plasmid maintenance system killer protein
LEIIFRTNKLEKEFNTHKLLVKRHGPRRAELIELRMQQIHAANFLEELRALPQLHCHELVGDHAGQLSVRLEQPYRLIFEPADDPIPRRPDGGLDWKRVTAVRILGVEDYHG